MSIKRSVLALALVAVLLLSALSVQKVPSYAHYIYPSPEVKTQTKEQEDTGESAHAQTEEKKKKEPSALQKQIKQVKEALQEQSGLTDAWLFTGFMQDAQVSVKHGDSKTAGLSAYQGDLHLVQMPALVSGRNLYQEELDAGSRVAVLSESLAIALFRRGDPIGEEIQLGEKHYRVVGVNRWKQTPGDHHNGCIWVPLKALDDDGIRTEVMQLSMRVAKGKGAVSRLKGVVSPLIANGEMLSAAKEKHRTMLPARLLLVALGLMLLALCYPVLTALSRGTVMRCRMELTQAYSYRLLPKWLLRALGLLLVWGVWGVGVYYIGLFAVQPVYIFPEWIPQIPVEVKDILSTFWQNRGLSTKLVQYSTPELLLLRFYRMVNGYAAGLLLVLLLKPYHYVAMAIKKRINSEQ